MLRYTAVGGWQHLLNFFLPLFRQLHICRHPQFHPGITRFNFVVVDAIGSCSGDFVAAGYLVHSAACYTTRGILMAMVCCVVAVVSGCFLSWCGVFLCR